MGSPDHSKQIQELLVTLKSLVRATEVCLTGVRTDNKEAQELIELAKQLTYNTNSRSYAECGMRSPQFLAGGDHGQSDKGC